MAQELQQNQRLGQHLTRQQIRFVRLLELNAPELDEAVETELETNPALEVADPEGEADRRLSDNTPYYLRHANNASADRPSFDFTPPDESESLYDYLLRQIDEKEISKELADIAKYIVGNLDSNGYLQRPLSGIIDDLAFNQDIDIPLPTAEKALSIVRELDPPGIGGENLRQTLLLQLQRLPDSEARQDAINILTDYFEPFYMRHSHKIISGLRISKDRLERANELILTLNPKPGAAFGGNAATAAGIIVPDFVVSGEGDELFISLNNRIPELAVEESFSEAMRGVERRRGRPKKGTEFISSRYNDAKDFIEILRQRQQTMLTVITAIVNHQKDFFDSGDVYALRPMMLRDISNATGLDISVISRATANKYVDTPWGSIMPVKSLFSDTVTDSGNEEKSPEKESQSDDSLTNRKVEALIAEIVEKEDKRHPLSDEKIRKILLERGHDISRRTIAKYRDRQGILIARLRKTL